LTVLILPVHPGITNTTPAQQTPSNNPMAFRGGECQWSMALIIWYPNPNIPFANEFINYAMVTLMCSQS
jgi:hypothetical protein